MQIKKFEAKSIKEALEMVKTHLGPEAIILSARDHHKGFGLVGENSIEVTAAISTNTLKKKILAEKKMNEEIRSKFQSSPARVQKQFIDKAFAAGVDDTMKRPITAVPYIDIEDERENSIRQKPSQVLNSQTQTDVASSTHLATERIRSAVKSAFTAGIPIMEKNSARAKKKVASSHLASAPLQDMTEVQALRNEISYLKNILEKFQKVPQDFVSMHPGAEDGLPYELSTTYEKLQQAGISDESAVTILKQCMQRLHPKQLKKKAFVDACIAQYFLDEIKVVKNRTSAKFHAFVGPSGQGKTSSLVKLASHMVVYEKKKVAIITTDYTKVGAAEQLGIYSQILNVPFAIVRRQSDWDAIQKKLASIDHFLVDFPGMNLRSIGELDFIRNTLPSNKSGQCVHYVQSVLANDTDTFEIAGRYMALGFSDVIFTFLDESVQHGLIYNFQKKFGVPLHSFGIGPKVPEDLEAATKERVIDLIFKLTKIRKL